MQKRGHPHETPSRAGWLARTIAHLAGAAQVAPVHLAEAIQLQRALPGA